jgi:hypothetical protein
MGGLASKVMSIHPGVAVANKLQELSNQNLSNQILPNQNQLPNLLNQKKCDCDCECCKKCHAITSSFGNKSKRKKSLKRKKQKKIIKKLENPFDL